MVTVETLAAFLAARYDEAEALATEARQETTGRWSTRETTWPGGLFVKDECGALILPAYSGEASPQYPHIAANDPAHRLADVKLKRAILAEHAHDDACSWPDRTKPRGFGCSICDWDRDYGQGDGGWCATVRQLGTEFAGHPAYKQEWRPE